MRRRLIWIVLLGVAGLIWSISPDNLLRNLATYVTARSPHERYAAILRLRALISPFTADSPFATDAALDETQSALAWRFPVRQVVPGDQISAGTVVGYVGDPLPFVCDAPCHR